MLKLIEVEKNPLFISGLKKWLANVTGTSYMNNIEDYFQIENLFDILGTLYINKKNK